MTFEEQQLTLVIKGLLSDELRPLSQELKDMRKDLANLNTEARLSFTQLQSRREYCMDKHAQVDARFDARAIANERALEEIRAQLAEGDKGSVREGQRMFVSWRERWNWAWVAIGALLLLAVQIIADKSVALLGG